MSVFLASAMQPSLACLWLAGRFEGKPDQLASSDRSGGGRDSPLWPPPLSTLLGSLLCGPLAGVPGKGAFCVCFRAPPSVGPPVNSLFLPFQTPEGSTTSGCWPTTAWRKATRRIKPSAPRAASVSHEGGHFALGWLPWSSPLREPLGSLARLVGSHVCRVGGERRPKGQWFSREALSTRGRACGRSSAAPEGCCSPSSPSRPGPPGAATASPSPPLRPGQRLVLRLPPLGAAGLHLQPSRQLHRPLQPRGAPERIAGPLPADVRLLLPPSSCLACLVPSGAFSGRAQEPGTEQGWALLQAAPHFWLLLVLPGLLGYRARGASQAVGHGSPPPVVMLGGQWEGPDWIAWCCDTGGSPWAGTGSCLVPLTGGHPLHFAFPGQRPTC